MLACDQLGAMWEGLEAALVEAGIAFDRFSQGYTGSWSDSAAAWRPAMPRVYEAVADADQQHAYGRLDKVQAALVQAAALDDFRAWLNVTHRVVRHHRHGEGEGADRRGKGLHRCPSTA